MLKKEWGAESNGKLPHLFIPGKNATLVSELTEEDLPAAEILPFVSRAYSEGPALRQNSLMMII